MKMFIVTNPRTFNLINHIRAAHEWLDPQLAFFSIWVYDRKNFFCMTSFGTLILHGETSMSREEFQISRPLGFLIITIAVQPCFLKTFLAAVNASSRPKC